MVVDERSHVSSCPIPTVAPLVAGKLVNDSWHQAHLLALPCRLEQLLVVLHLCVNLLHTCGSQGMSTRCHDITTAEHTCCIRISFLVTPQIRLLRAAENSRSNTEATEKGANPTAKEKSKAQVKRARQGGLVED